MPGEPVRIYQHQHVRLGHQNGGDQFVYMDLKLICGLEVQGEMWLYPPLGESSAHYRLCSDQIRTPSLRQQIEESPGVLSDLILFISRRVAGDEAEILAEESRRCIDQNLDPKYEWPGNYRKQYESPHRAPKQKAVSDLFAEARNGALTANGV